MMLPINGKPLILHTLERAVTAETVSRAIVATDDQRIFDAVSAAGHQAVMTSPAHSSGSDRVAEVSATLPEGSIIVNIQGDEPVISPETIDRAVNALLEDRRASVSTISEPILSAAEALDPNVVKVVTGADGRAVYFSRAPVPFPRDAVIRHGSIAAALANEPEMLANFKKHTGLYVYRREYLLEFTRQRPTVVETTEMLEQLRALENGAVIKVVEAAGPSIGVDTPEDLARVRNVLEATEAKFQPDHTAA